MVTIYHSVPKDLMMDDAYLALMGKHFSRAKHILDCAESNIPMLSKSKATFFTERIKMVCPLLFPTSTTDMSDLTENFKNDN